MMKRQYTEQEINLFFTRFKQLPECFEIEKVHQLINNPDAKATHRINFKYKPFKFMIMTSLFVVGISSLLFWFTPIKIIENRKSEPLNIEKSVNQTQQFVSNAREINIDKKKTTRKTDIAINPIHNTEIFTKSVAYEDTNEVLSQLLEPIDTIKEIIEIGRQTDSVIAKIHYIELSKDQYTKIGFIIGSDKIQIRTNGFNVFLSKDGRGVELLGVFKWKVPKINPIFLSNKIGEQMIKWSTFGEDKNKFEDDYFKNKIQNLIPIIMRQRTFPDILTEDQIFWFEPSEALFNSLPESIGNELRMEYNYITAETEEKKQVLSTNCTYFEACKSTLKVENCKLYPNPANGSVTIDFVLQESANGII